MKGYDNLSFEWLGIRTPELYRNGRLISRCAGARVGFNELCVGKSPAKKRQVKQDWWCHQGESDKKSG